MNELIDRFIKREIHLDTVNLFTSCREQPSDKMLSEVEVDELVMLISSTHNPSTFETEDVEIYFISAEHDYNPYEECETCKLTQDQTHIIKEILAEEYKKAYIDRAI